MLESTSPASKIQLTAVCVSTGLINVAVSFGTAPQNWYRWMLRDLESSRALLFVFLFSPMKPGTGLLLANSPARWTKWRRGGCHAGNWRRMHA